VNERLRFLSKRDDDDDGDDDDADVIMTSGDVKYL